MLISNLVADHVVHFRPSFDGLWLPSRLKTSGPNFLFCVSGGPSILQQVHVPRSRKFISCFSRTSFLLFKKFSFIQQLVKERERGEKVRGPLFVYSAWPEDKDHLDAIHLNVKKFDPSIGSFSGSRRSSRHFLGLMIDDVQFHHEIRSFIFIQRH